ncbi:hypothetical protein CEXT_505351 [Caerostris extrusa]|uniref:Uncharacterized protein n=1 Tax=Caerostris extrusa TaxID=172846 RepID=A0AAV4UCR8_CAEEX|nr:hypothetical protein CEXT_505351 [Caerostris extrusa]
MENRKVNCALGAGSRKVETSTANTQSFVYGYYGHLGEIKKSKSDDISLMFYHQKNCYVSQLYVQQPALLSCIESVFLRSEEHTLSIAFIKCYIL